MSNKNNVLIQFADNTRTTTFFRSYAIAQIKMAYRIMEYLAPDSTYPPDNIDSVTKELMLREKYDEAFDRLENDGCVDDVSSSYWGENLKEDAKGLMAHLLPQYQAAKKSAKEERRLELLKELGELDDE